MPKRELYDAAFELHAETDKAILVSDNGGKTKVWLPKSQIEFEKKADGSVEVTMPVWLAKEKEIV